MCHISTLLPLIVTAGKTIAEEVERIMGPYGGVQSLVALNLKDPELLNDK